MTYPSKLAEKAPERRRFCSEFTLTYARMQVAKGDAVAIEGQAAKAILEAAHARVSAARRWVLNEKGLVEAAGLGAVQARFSAIPRDAEPLIAWVDRLRSDLAA